MRLLALIILLSGCADPVVCVDGRLYTNVDPLLIHGNIYQPTNAECKEIK